MKASERLEDGGFKLRKWLTNNTELRDLIKCSQNSDHNLSNDQATYAKVMLGGTEPGGEKVLGLHWNCETDMFSFQFVEFIEKAKGLIMTKRNLLSLLSGLYDPLGIISPIVVSMKILFQELCVDQVRWDEEVTGEKRKLWERWLKDLEMAGEMLVPRCLYDIGLGEVSCSVHGFADASAKANCAVVYFVCKGSLGIRLLTSKSRVAPLKSQTIPRLELMSDRILAQLVDTMKSALRQEVDIVSTRLWLDSKTALCWINNQQEWKQFVRHRVN